MSAREIATIVLLGLGVLLELVACLGIVAMRGVYDRLHFTGLTTLGAAAIAAAVLVDDSFSMIGDSWTHTSHRSWGGTMTSNVARLAASCTGWLNEIRTPRRVNPRW